VLSVIATAHDAEAPGGELVWIQAARNDREAFTPLYCRYRDQLFAYVRTRTDDSADAEDLTQQIFLRALDALPRYSERGIPFVAWLFQIARNTMTDHYRRHRSTVTWDLVPENLLPAAAQDLEEDTIRREAVATLGNLVRALDTDRRELLALRFGARLTVGEIAAVLGKREAATRKKLARTLHTLANQFEGVR
jgi:RNA polymerase sigma-70 factor (ECF subfamily)